MPGIYVVRIVPATSEKRIEIVTLARNDDQPSDPSSSPEKAAAIAQRHRIAKRAAKEIKDGFSVNLGIGMPTLVPEFLDAGIQVWLQSENGIIGMGPYPTKKQLDAQVSPFFSFWLFSLSNSSSSDIINAGKETVTLLPGASVFGNFRNLKAMLVSFADLKS